MTSMFMILSSILAAFLMMKHPLSLVLMLIILTMVIMFYALMINNLSWLSMILFLVFLGGLLIIFTYLSALVPNEVNFFNLGWFMVLLSPAITSMFMNTPSSSSLKLNLMLSMNLNESSAIFLFLGYLLVTLVVMMLMAKYLKSPLNQSNY